MVIVTIFSFSLCTLARQQPLLDDVHQNGDAEHEPIEDVEEEDEATTSEPESEGEAESESEAEGEAEAEGVDGLVIVLYGHGLWFRKRSASKSLV